MVRILFFSLFTISLKLFPVDLDPVSPCIQQNTLCAMIEKYGDHNGDGTITTLDASLINQAILLLSSYSLELDLNLDGVNNLQDAQIIQQYVLGIIDCNQNSSQVYQCEWHATGGFCKNDPQVLSMEAALGGNDRIITTIPSSVVQEYEGGELTAIDNYFSGLTGLENLCKSAVALPWSQPLSDSCKEGSGVLTIPPKFISFYNSEPSSLVILEFLCECECKDSVSCDDGSGIIGGSSNNKRSSNFTFLDELGFQSIKSKLNQKSSR